MRGVLQHHQKWMVLVNAKGNESWQPKLPVVNRLSPHQPVSLLHSCGRNILELQRRYCSQ
nr:MAG TPA: hypothetical protein [Caudoviricetes sp.]